MNIRQNVDVAIKRKDYDSLGKDKLKISSYFRTIQGEGKYAGYPAIFLRLAGCNFGAKDVNCSWCDTAFHFSRGEVWDLDLLLEVLMNIPGYNGKDILVITGGEPTLQHNLIEFIDRAYGKGTFSAIQMETNGTQSSYFNAVVARGTQYQCSTTVSPKASYKANKYAPLADVVLDCADVLKFVLEDVPDSPHYTIPEWALMVTDIDVYVSPMAVYKRPYVGEVSSAWDAELINQEATARNYNYAARYAMQHNLKISTQQHLFLTLA